MEQEEFHVGTGDEARDVVVEELVNHFEVPKGEDAEEKFSLLARMMRGEGQE